MEEAIYMDKLLINSSIVQWGAGNQYWRSGQGTQAQETPQAQYQLPKFTRVTIYDERSVEREHMKICIQNSNQYSALSSAESLFFSLSIPPFFFRVLSSVIC